MRKKYERQAWLLDEDVFYQGMVCKRVFYPSSSKGGFCSQSLRKRDFGKVVFYDLDEAKRITGYKKVVQ